MKIKILNQEIKLNDPDDKPKKEERVLIVVDNKLNPAYYDGWAGELEYTVTMGQIWDDNWEDFELRLVSIVGWLPIEVIK